MTFFVGHTGAIQLQRSGDLLFTASLNSADVNTVLNRIGLEEAGEDLLSGDSIELTTTDARGLLFLPRSFWGIPGETVDGYSGHVYTDGATTGLAGWDDDNISALSTLPPNGYEPFDQSDYIYQQNARVYVNVNAVGGVRLFNTFTAAINNDRNEEINLQEFYGDPLILKAEVFDSRPNILGSVTSYTINTERSAIETTSLSDKFKQQYAAGLLSGNGSIECLFNYEALPAEEAPLYLLQVLKRVEIGSQFKAILALMTSEMGNYPQQVFYEITAIATRAGVTVASDALVDCSIDFVTTGEFRLVIGTPPEYILKEDYEAIYLEQGLEYLLKEIED
jgi:hypothetical protein